jgi:hypothetical protein
MHAIDFANDRGGNDRIVDFSEEAPTVKPGEAPKPKRGNLHSLWDGGMLKDMLKRDQMPDVKRFAQVLFQELEEGKKTAGGTAKMPFYALSPFQMLEKTIWDWAWETHAGGVSSYQNESGDMKGTTLPPVPGTKGPDGKPLPAAPFEVKTEYAHSAEALIKEQLKKGGLRLADLLDKALNE